MKFSPALIALASLSAPAWAYVPPATLEADGGVSPLGGDIHQPHQDFDYLNANATVASAPEQGSAALGVADGSYADAYALAAFGNLHAYSDAHRTYTGGAGDAQSSADATFTDYVLASTNVPAIGYINYTLTLNLSGSHTPGDAHTYPGFSALAQMQWDVRNNANGTVLARGVFDTTDAHPDLTTSVAISASPGVLMQVTIGLSTFTYVSPWDAAQYLTAVADYKDTLKVNLDAVTPGANTLGASGFDYATPAVPEPQTAALMVVGLVLLGACGRKRRG